MFKSLRSVCASEIQRIWRGVWIRNVYIENPRKRVVLRWRWGSKSVSGVYVAGEFSDWKKWPMVYCAVGNDHRLSIPLVKLMGVTKFAYKFVVDGLWTCDGLLPMEEEEGGNVNNVFTLKKSPQTPGAHRLRPRSVSKSRHVQVLSPPRRLPMRKEFTSPLISTTHSSKLPPPSVAVRGT